MSDAVARGLAFLAARQRPDGAFPAFVVNDTGRPPGVAVPDLTLFPTALIADSLAWVEGPGRDRLLDPALRFLRGEMEASGVWRFWTREDPRRAMIPPDCDDTAVVGRVLAANGVAIPDHRKLLLACRAPDGRFYTWLAPRWTQPPRSPAFWRVALRLWRAPLRSYAFWQVTPAQRSDIDVVVNVNVLRRLGDGPDTAAVAPYVADVVARGAEASADKWYPDPRALHYAVSSAVREGCASLAVVRDELVQRLLAAQAPDGSWGGTAYATALGACSLLNWDDGRPALDRALDHLLAAQAPDGSWPIGPAYTGGPGADQWWGAPELTTALALEALARAGR